MIRVRTTTNNQPTNQPANNQQPLQIPSLHSFLQRHFGFAPLRPFAMSGTRPETNSNFAPENGWLRDDPFILWPGLFSVTICYKYTALYWALPKAVAKPVDGEGCEQIPFTKMNRLFLQLAACLGPLQGVSFDKEINRHNTTRCSIWNPTVTNWVWPSPAQFQS